MKPFRRFTVTVPLPDALSDLEVLARNLRWSWHPETTDLFASIDPTSWSATGDPLRILRETSPTRLAELAADAPFLARVAELRADLNAYLTGETWFERRVRRSSQGNEACAAIDPLPSTVAYFSMEFGISEVLPIYSGGLGVLAGDHLKAASDLGVGMIGVGLMYRHGYFRQGFTRDGWQIEHYPVNDPSTLPVVELTDSDGPVRVTVSMPEGRTLTAGIQVAQIGRIPLLLLDSDIAENDPDLRDVTDRLYGGDQEHRIKQEILLGVGGVRALRAYTSLTCAPAPSVFHMNEGHAGFLGVERIRELVAAHRTEGGDAHASDGLDFDSAEAVVRASTVFTTHTPVPAGIDRFPLDLVRRHLCPEVDGTSRLLPGLEVSTILDLGDEADPGVFNMAHMGFRLGQRSNGVSRLHGAVSREMFADLWPGFDAEEVPIGSITNGVHGPTWMARRWQELGALGSAEAQPDISGLDDVEIWAVRGELRSDLVAEVRRRSRRAERDRGFTAAEIGMRADVFDPDVLTIGFARRAATYKRLTLMLRDRDRLRAMLTDPQRPVQLVIAGKAHPADHEGKTLIQQIIAFADEASVRHRIVFLPDYDISMARHIYAGCDVWLNNPIRPMEACGTSGMKSALNGGLNLSILDGWWDEMADEENGWAIGSAEGVQDEALRDDLEAEALYALLEDSVIAEFYDRDDHGVPRRWVSRMRHTLTDLGPKVSASRMVIDYTDDLYTPAALSHERICAEGYSGARSLADLRRRLDTGWSAIEVASIDHEVTGTDSPTTSPPMVLTADIGLGTFTADEVSVQAIIGRCDPEGRDPHGADRSGPDAELSSTEIVAMTPTQESTTPGRVRYRAEFELTIAGDLGYTVRVVPRHPHLTVDAELGLVRYPRSC